MGIFFIVILIAEILEKLYVTNNLLRRYRKIYKSKDLLLDRLSMDFNSNLLMGIGMLVGWFIAVTATKQTGGSLMLMYAITFILLLYYLVVMMDFYLIDRLKEEITK
ncbi:MAG: hypothetical protein E7H54_05840 [Clostridium perfringens]|nr:hypothetical protein [Clostridium perfringens]